MKARPPAAFSLIELLVVIALVAILTTMSLPAIVSLMQGQGMKRSVSATSDILEYARTEAMAKSTWVWVGISSTNNNAVGNPEITLIAVASKDGTTNSATNNISVISKPLRVENVVLMTNLTSYAPTNAVNLTNGTFQFTAVFSGKTNVFPTNTVLAFSPQGEVLLNPTTVSSWIEIGLREKRGATEITNKTASIRVSGISGQVVVNY